MSTSSSSQPTLRGTNLVELLAEPRYAKLKHDHGYSLAGVPFVGPADRHRPLKAGKCIISATYTDSKRGAVSWLVQASRKTFSSLKWSRLESMQQRQPASNPEFELVPVPSAKSIVKLRIDIPFSDNESTQQTSDTVLREAPSPTSFELLTELILVGFDHGSQFDIPSAFLWETSFPALTIMKIEGHQTVRDVRALLRGCPELTELAISTITTGPHGDDEEITHEGLRDLTIASAISVAQVLRNLKLGGLRELKLWMLPEVVCGLSSITTARALAKSVKEIKKQDKLLSLKINFDASHLKSYLDATIDVGIL